ncbi:homoserine kinase [Sutterella sp.]|uniref:homoserine kinase n=1 Tax=Sutterella sp. TaxID=1981025 RepID=UPI0026E05906|nr:homoserine kinase [Sutterella sp.]MDO5531491.1 homoserine kinase [Sutterella sp.]
MLVTVRAPASTSNLGPGFDCLGLALSLTSTFTFELNDTLVIDGCPEEFRNEDNLVIQGFREVYMEAGETPPNVHLTIEAEVPVARGLGSSSTCFAAGVAAANAYLGNRFTREQLFQICARFEGHPDNAAPCMLGGLSASFATEDDFHSVPLALDPEWRFATVIPDYEVKTHEARAAMPKEISVKDSVFTTSHAIAMIHALREGDEKLLALACRDRLHEPCRKKLIRDYDALRALALASGCAAFFISGSGSTLIAMTRSQEVAERFTREAVAKFPTFGAHILRAVEGGTQVTIS